MTKSKTKTNGNRRGRQKFRRFHRWVGVPALVFVLFLATSGITLNHASDLGLDRRYVDWSWLLGAYGIQSPEPSASYADGGIRGTLLGEHLFLDGKDTGQRMPGLAGVVAIDILVLAAGERTAHVFLASGELVEAIDLSAAIPGPIERIGRVNGRAVIQSNNELFRSDEGTASFEPWGSEPVTDIQWSRASPLGTEELAVLDAAWRGRGVTIERVLLDLHSGKLLGLPGTLFMDLVALCMIILGLSGLMLSSRYRRGSHPEV